MAKRRRRPEKFSVVKAVKANARRLRGHGAVKIPLYQSETAHALTARTKTTRVVWFTPGRLTTVQCVLVRRTGNVLAGARFYADSWDISRSSVPDASG